MKYVNSLKYINSFEHAMSQGDISVNRVGELCSLIGRVNIGTNCIFIPGSPAGHATAVMFESVIKSAGYKIGRISMAFGIDSRDMVSLDGENARIDDYNHAVAELKNVIINRPQEKYFREEVSYVLALLLCKMYACDYIIIEAGNESEGDLASLCSPYDMVLVPTVYDGDESVNLACDAIRHGVREVISGNQRKAFYDMILSACVSCGARLTLTSKTSFKTEECSSINVSFSYGERGGYSIKSPSLIQRECAMLIIESALAIRRDGVKMPWASISAGLSCATGTGCFDTLSVAPLLILDSAGSDNEANQFILSLHEVLNNDGKMNAVLCLPAGSVNLYRCFSDIEISSVIIVGDEEGAELLGDVEHVACSNCRNAAEKIFELMKKGINTICLGSVRFEKEMKQEIAKFMNY